MLLTDKQTNSTKNITSYAKEVIILEKENNHVVINFLHIFISTSYSLTRTPMRLLLNNECELHVLFISLQSFSMEINLLSLPLSTKIS